MKHDLNDKMDLIEAYIDGGLDGQQKIMAEQALQQDAELQEKYEEMQLAVNAVKLSALNSQVKAIAQAHFLNSEAEPTVTIQPSAKVVNIKFYALRVAAVLLLVCASYIALEYLTVSPQKIYAEEFNNYDLPVSRGASKIAIIEQQYKSEQWEEVIQTVSSENLPDQKDLFLAGMSSMQLNKWESASNFFNKVISINSTAGKKAYQDESEFYLALTYLKMNNTDKAVSLLSSIRSTPEHAYNAQAKKLNGFQLTLLKWKH